MFFFDLGAAFERLFCWCPTCTHFPRTEILSFVLFVLSRGSFVGFLTMQGHSLDDVWGAP